MQFNSLPGGLSTTTTAGSVGGMTNRGPVAVAQLPAPPVVGAPGGPQGMRRIQTFPRSQVPYNYQATSNPDRNETIIQLRQGVMVIINGLPNTGTLDISADNMVLWTTGATGMNGETVQDNNVPLEIYMEGNIVFRQGDRTIYAQRMYYDVRQQVGTVLSAEILSPAPQFAGLMRLRADVVTQTGPGRFVMQNAYATSSRLALPGYRLQAKTALFEDNEVPVIDPGDEPAADRSGNGRDQ